MRDANCFAGFAFRKNLLPPLGKACIPLEVERSRMIEAEDEKDQPSYVRGHVDIALCQRTSIIHRRLYSEAVSLSRKNT
jgi:hypothetical protein